MEKGLSNKFLNKVLYKTAPSYSGCWSCNNIPYHLVTNLDFFSLVVNTANRGERGEHFISLLISPLTIRIFDSQATFILPVTLRFNLKKHFPKKRIIFIPSRAIQHPESVFCGFFSIYSVLTYEKHIRECKKNRGCYVNLKMCRPFHRKSLEQNDDICVNQIVKLLKK